MAVSRKRSDTTEKDNEELLALARRHGWEIEPDPAVREAARQDLFRAIREWRYASDGTPYPARDELYDEMIEERSR